MAKFYIIVAIFALALAMVTAEPPSLRQSKRFGNLRIQSNRKLSRQEVASDVEPSSAPYPPAGVTPEIPFSLPTETEAPVAEPDQTYGPPEPKPDETYGPPELKPDQSYGPPEADDIPGLTEPDNTYLPPTTDYQPGIDEPEAEKIPPSNSNLVSEFLIQPRNKNIRFSQSAFPNQRLRSAALRRRNAAVEPRFIAVEIFRSEPVLTYTLH